jgi:hypothetical protein
MRSLALLSFLLFFLAITGYPQHTIHGDGTDITQNRSIPAFQKLHNSIFAEVIVQIGDKYEVKVEGESNVVEALVTEVKDGELDIHFPWMKNVQTTRKLTVWVTTPGNLTEVSNSGSGGIRTDDKFKTSTMSLHNSGSGGIEIALDADQLDMGMSGSGHILVKGQAKQLQCSISGSGSVRGPDLAITERAEVHVSGSGSCTITANGALDGHISGSGGINYLGNPSEVNVSHSGSGRARRIS